MESFATIDFETATSQRASACAVAVTIVDDGQISASYSSLIKPPNNEYDGFNMMLHGISPEMTIGSPSFNYVLPQIMEVIRDRTLVAHSGAFDFGVLRDECNRLGITPPPIKSLGCTVVMGRRAWPDCWSHSLPILSSFLNIPEFNHHDPVADSQACASIMIKILEKVNAKSVEEATQTLHVRLGSLGGSNYTSCASLASLYLTTPEPGSWDPDNPFVDVDVAFTGALSSMTRNEAAQIVVNAGGRFSSSVSKKTEYLVSGEQDFRKLVHGELSNKMIQATKQIKEGHHIQIISESDFLRML